MPRRTMYLLRWSEERQYYESVASNDGDVARVLDLKPDSSAWFDWLNEIISFSFAGRSGTSYTVRKEKMQRGGFYWYGYRSLQVNYKISIPLTCASR